jgi:hypothetical protein
MSKYFSVETVRFQRKRVCKTAKFLKELVEDEVNAGFSVVQNA